MRLCIVLGAVLLVGCGEPDLDRGRASSALLSAFETTATARVMVALAPSARRDSVLAAVDPQDFELVRGFETVSAMAGNATQRGVEQLMRHPDVRAIGLDPPSKIALLESVPLIGADEVQLAGIEGQGVTVAVLDTGIDAAHPDLANVPLLAEHCFCDDGMGGGCCPNNSDEQEGPGSAIDDHGHGTTVTSIIASQGVVAEPGVAPGVSVVAVRVLDQYGYAVSSAQIIAALEWIATNQPTVRVVNMSLVSFELFSTTCDDADAWTMAYAGVIETLRRSGVTVFAASGNDGVATQVAAPACIDATIAVGAVYDADVGGLSASVCQDATTAADQVACFSNAATMVDLLAPGALITASKLGGGTDTGFGTSYASPQAAGAAALLLCIDSMLAPDAIETMLEMTGESVTDLRNNLVFPRVDVIAAARTLGLPECGDGVVHQTEECDDANATSGDGCNRDCDEEPGYHCIDEPSMCTTQCGDGVKTDDEECDDGDTSGGDGCSADCKREPMAEGGSGGAPPDDPIVTFEEASLESCRDNCCCEAVGGRTDAQHLWCLLALAAYGVRRRRP